MSVVVMKRVFQRVVGSARDKAVLLYLADRASDNGSNAYPAIPTIAQATEVSERSVQRAIRDLVDRGLLIEAGFVPCDRGFKNNYSINLDQLAELPKTSELEREEARLAKADSTGVRVSPHGRQSVGRVSGCHPTGDTVSGKGCQPVTQTILEPSFNLSLSSRESERDEIQLAFDAWNALADRAGLPKAQKLTKPRRSQLGARLRDAGGLSGWEVALGYIEASEFHTGKKPGSAGTYWKADLTWLLKPENFLKTMEKGNAKRSNPSAGNESGFTASAKNTSGSRRGATIASLLAERKLREGR